MVMAVDSQSKVQGTNLIIAYQMDVMILHQYDTAKTDGRTLKTVSL